MARKQILRKYSPGDIIDQVLDKGIVIDVTACVSLPGVEHILDVDARVSVASIDSHVQYAGRLSRTGSTARPTRTHRRLAEDRLLTTSTGIIQHTHRVTPSFDDQIRARGLSIRLGRRT
jgi:hypothetical protein